MFDAAPPSRGQMRSQSRPDPQAREVAAMAQQLIAARL